MNKPFGIWAFIKTNWRTVAVIAASAMTAGAVTSKHFNGTYNPWGTPTKE